MCVRCRVVRQVIKKALPKPKPKKVVRKPTSTRKPGSGGKRPTVIRNKLTRDIDPAFSPEQIGKALGLLGQVKDGFGGQGIPTGGIIGVGVWGLLVLRYTIFYGFFGE